ncbi:hypothetical protein J4402_01485 [Candidatus Pacearchaeota archaeon]|nr:hypothetical protein [Candidatus Pacearchaeota archaeon]
MLLQKMTPNLSDNKKAQSSILVFLFILILFLLASAALVFLLFSYSPSTVKKEITNSNYNEIEQDAVFIPISKDIIDTDEDSVEDIEDNCPLHFNPFQEDKDEDGKGDACDVSRSNRNSHDDDDEIECSSNSDCGTGALTGNRFCQSGDVYQNFKNHTCNNPGKTSSSCSSSTTPKLIQDCIFGCANGTCIVPACSTNTDCDDSNNYTEDICKNPGTSQSYCEHNPIACLKNMDCGFNELIGNLFCSSNNLNVLQLFQSWICLSPGTAQSSCSSSTTPQIIQTCSDICVNGECKDIECYNNADCGTDGLINQPTCSGLNVVQDFKIFRCNNPGTPQSSCSFSLCQEIQQLCSDACIAGICADIECYNNADCNDANLLTEDICHNPATPESYCTNELISECIPGQTQQCGTSNIGECDFGTKTCNSYGSWNSECVGEVLPSNEICDGKDNDGQVCYSGTGQCRKAGNFVCSSNGLTTNCNAVAGTPTAEICDGKDNDCDGSTDENNVCASGCTSECPVFEARQCTSGGYRVCGNFDTDSCLDWSLITQCGLGSTCSGGYCV